MVARTKVVISTVAFPNNKISMCIIYNYNCFCFF